LLTSHGKSIAGRLLEMGLSERIRCFGGNLVRMLAGLHEGSAAAAKAAELAGELLVSIRFLQGIFGVGFVRAKTGAAASLVCRCWLLGSENSCPASLFAARVRYGEFGLCLSVYR
jgi:hypothetical protein